MSFPAAEGSFGQVTKAAFLQHLIDHPSPTRRVSPSQKETMIEWLTNSGKRPRSQEEFSRRNYVRKTFHWDAETGTLSAIAKRGNGVRREVIETDRISDTVEAIHSVARHPGWDATWKEVNRSCYGILRADVVFLLKRCQVCARDPSKRPKKPSAASSSPATDSSLSGEVGSSFSQYEHIQLSISPADGPWGQLTHIGVRQLEGGHLVDDSLAIEQQDDAQDDNLSNEAMHP